MIRCRQEMGGGVDTAQGNVREEVFQANVNIPECDPV